MQNTKLDAITLLVTTLSQKVSSQIPFSRLKEVCDRFIGELIWENLGYEFTPLIENQKEFLTTIGSLLFDSFLSENFDMEFGLTREKFNDVLNGVLTQCIPLFPSHVQTRFHGKCKAFWNNSLNDAKACSGITKNGNKCKNKTLNPNGRCHNHCDNVSSE